MPDAAAFNASTALAGGGAGSLAVAMLVVLLVVAAAVGIVGWMVFRMAGLAHRAAERTALAEEAGERWRAALDAADARRHDELVQALGASREAQRAGEAAWAARWQGLDAQTARALQSELDRAVSGQIRPLVESVVHDASSRQREHLGMLLADASRVQRGEQAGHLDRLQQALLGQLGDAVRTQNEQIDTFRVQLAAMQRGLTDALADQAHRAAQQAQALRDAQDVALARLGETLGGTMNARLAELGQTTERRLSEMQQRNEAQLEQMRATVDEKLHATLEQRLGDSFRQVAERLEQVHQGLGEMRTLARDVGSLNRTLTNVKTRGVFGEVQLGALLEQVFTPDQYASNVETVPGSRQRVEYAIRLPGRDGSGDGVWLPIDAKFPREDYERLLDAQERADAPAADAAARAMEQRLRSEARSIREKYVASPHTTDFAIMFLPTESLYAEALRRPGLVEGLQREHAVVLAGPTTLLATLSSLRMGFRTLALEQQSAQIHKVLGAVKTEFGRFGVVLDKVKNKLEAAGKEIDQVGVRTRQMTRQLRSVEAMPGPEALQVLGLPDARAGGSGLGALDDDEADGTDGDTPDLFARGGGR